MNSSITPNFYKFTDYNHNRKIFKDLAPDLYENQRVMIILRPSLVKIGVKDKDLVILRNVKYLEEFANEFNNKDLSLPFRLFCKMLYCFINFGYVDMESRQDILMDFFLAANPSLQNYLDFFTLVDNFWKEEKLCGLI